MSADAILPIVTPSAVHDRAAREYTDSRALTVQHDMSPNARSEQSWRSIKAARC